MRGRAFMSFLVASLVLAVPAASLEPTLPRPVVHEEVGRAWDELARELQGLGSRWREHFSDREARGERPLITFMLRHRDDLALSSEQVRGLERLRSDFQREAIRRDADLRVAEMDLSALLDSHPVDLSKVEAKVREIERFRADLRLSRIRTIEEGKALLSAEQREKLRNLLTGPQHSRLRSGTLR